MSKKTALITGASGGIGLELAKLFAKDGYRLILVARDEKRLAKLAQELTGQGNEVKTVALDLSQSTAPQQLMDQLKRDGVSVDVLVNNAGFGLFGNFSETSWPKEKDMIQLNMVTLTELTKLVLPEMVSRKSGKILNVASTAAFQPGPLMAVYYATKAYVLYFSEAIAEELRGTGVTVTALCPGPTKSGFQKLAEMENSKLVQGNTDSPETVARLGYRALMGGKRIVITGLRNKILAHSIRFMPRSLVTKVVMDAQKPVTP
jgi:uncharacterized protein